MSSLGIAISVCLVYYSGPHQVVIAKFAIYDYKAATLSRIYETNHFYRSIWSCDGVGPFGVYTQCFDHYDYSPSPSAAIL